MNAPCSKRHLSERSVMNRNAYKTNYSPINLEIAPFLYGRNLASVTTYNSFNNMLNTSLYTPDGDWSKLLRYPTTYLHLS
jgi:hypothetical protein